MGVFDKASFFTGPEPEPGLSDLAAEGLRSGALAARGQLNKVAGTVMDSVGLDGSGRNAAALRDQALAQAEGRDLVPLSDVHDVTSGLRYGAGAVGQMLPMAGAAVGAGLLTRSPSAALKAGTAVTAPFELGGQLQRQEQDPENLWATPGERLRAATPAAVAAAAAQNIIPAGVASRMAGRAAAGGAKEIALRAAADIPANAVASGAAEGIRQLGDQQLNPNAPFHPEAIKEAAIEGGAMGAVFGGLGAVGHAVHSSGAAIKATPGRAIEAAKGLVPDSVSERVGGAVEGAGDTAAKVAEWAKGSIQKRTDDVRAWGKEFMADEAADGSFKARVQDALANPGDTANQAWMATEKFARDAASAAKAKLDEADIPTRLRNLYESAKSKDDALVDKVAEGREVADHNAPDQASAQAEADRTTLQKAMDWATQLSNQHLGDEKTAELKQAMATIGEKSSQMKIAALKRGQDAVQRVSEAIDKFHKDVAAKAAEKGSTKKSEDYSGARRAIGEAVSTTLGPDHPALHDPKQLAKLADGLRPYIEQVAQGKVLDSFDKLDHLSRLYDVLGEKTTDVLHAVHMAVSGASKDDARVFQTLNQIDEIVKGKQGVLETLEKNLRPEMQGSVTTHELRAEAEMLDKWARSKAAEPAAAEKAKFTDGRIKAALQHRYGDKAELVMKAVEKNVKHEQNVIESVRTKEVEDETQIGDSAGKLDEGVREGNADAETSKVRYYPENGQLYLDPRYARDDPQYAKYGDPATQRMTRAQKENPKAAVQFRTAREIGLDDPMVKAKHADLVDEYMADHPKGTDAEAKAWADKHIDRFGAVTAETSKQETAISSAELGLLKLNAKKFGNSPARIEAGDGVILDAVKMTEFMHDRMKDSGIFPAEGDKSAVARDARLFSEAVAAVQDHLGRSFEIGDDVQINRRGLTWGEAQKALRANDVKSTAGSAKIEDRVARLEARRDALIRPVAEDLINDLKAAGVKLTKKNVGDAYRQAREQLADQLKPIEDGIAKLLRENVADDTAGRQGNDEAGFEGNVQRGLVLNKVRMREIEAELAKIDNSTAAGRARESALMEEFGRLSLDRNATTDKTPADLGTGRKEIDPFGPTHDVMRGGDDPAAIIRTNSDGSARGDTVMGRRKPAVSIEEGTSDPKAVAAKQAAFTEKARSGDPELIKSLKASTDAKGLQRAVEHIAEMKGEGFAKTVDAINERLSELVQNRDVAYGLQTRKYSLMSTQVHDDLGRLGFPATHDSPIRHEGKFDWREHSGKGEGAAAFGAGTYLSTGDGVHNYYKKAFTNAVLEERNNAFFATSDEGYKAPGKGLGADKSPTYHVSVDIAPERLMNWDKPLSEQSPSVKLRLLKALKDNEIERPPEKLEWDRDGETTWSGGNGSSEAIIELQDGAFKLYVDGDYVESFRGLDQAKARADSDLAGTGKTYYKLLADHFAPKDEHGNTLDAELGQRIASEYLQSLGIYGHEYAAANGRDGKTPNYVIYDDSKINTNYVHFSQERVDPNATGPVDRKAVMDYLGRTHGQSISVAWRNIMHAGEFDRTATGDVIGLSVHALNPMSVAYHESLHGFFAKLRDAKQSDIAAVLERAGNSAPVLNQLRKLLANEPEALKQLSDPEERAAYMYQFWAQGKLTVGPETKNVFQRIAEFIRSVVGVWSNDERAQHILDYFHSGEYEKARSDPNAVYRALMESGKSRAFEQAKAMTQPVREMGEALASAGGARLRDTGIPALRELADAMKLKTTSEGTDHGYLPAARAERSRLMNQLGSDLHGYSADHINEAVEAMQNGVKPQSTEAKIVARIVQKRLDEALTYMKDAGVNIEAIGQKDGVPYFPRSWDASFISSHQAEFLRMVEKYKLSGQYKGDPRELLNKLMVTDGAEFNVEVSKPGMQHAKERVLSFISHEDAAPFMRKNLFEIMNSYVTQATRRAEWARRFGDDGSGIATLLSRAKAEGATKEQLASAEKFVKAVDGTLGDTINPTARRLMGNMIVYQNIRLLPLAIFSSVVDSQGIIVRGGTAGEAFKTFTRGMREVVKNFQKDPQSDSMTRLAETLGVVDSAMLVHTLGASYSQGMVGNTGRAINDTFFRLNLMEQYNTSMRVGATEAAMNFIARHATQPTTHSARFLSELGLTAADVQLDHAGRPKLLESDGLSLEQAAKMKSAVNRWVDGAVLRPDAVDKPVWMSDPHFALVAHLKQFVFSFHETILKRVVHEAQAGNYTPAMALASYVPMMIAADFLKGFIQGGGSQPSWKEGWGPEDYVWSGMERAGLFGTGQFAIDALGDVQHGGSGIGALSGPTIEQLTESLRVLGGAEQFKSFAVKSLPANALYASALKAEATDPKFAD